MLRIAAKYHVGTDKKPSAACYVKALYDLGLIESRAVIARYTKSLTNLEDYMKHTAKDDIPAMDPKSLEFVGNLLWNALPILETKLLPKKK